MLLGAVRPEQAQIDSGMLAGFDSLLWRYEKTEDEQRRGEAKPGASTQGEDDPWKEEGSPTAPRVGSCSHRSTVRTVGFHPADSGSIPLESTTPLSANGKQHRF